MFTFCYQDFPISHDEKVQFTILICVFFSFLFIYFQIIAWADFLLLLEGEAVHLPAPKTSYAKDFVIESDTPIFCTTSQPIQLIRGGVVLERETAMMAVRWKHYQFYHQIPFAQQRRLRPCSRCFAAFVLQRDDNPPAH